MRVLASGMEWFTDNPGGLPRYFADYLAAWTQSGEEAQAYVRAVDGVGSELHPPYVRALPLDTKNPLRVRKMWGDTFRGETRRRRYDVFNPHFAYYAWGWSGVKPDIPVVTHFHGPWAYEALMEKPNQVAWKRALEFRMQNYIEQAAYRHSDRFIVLSEFFRNELIERYRVPVDRVHVIPGAVDPKHFQDSMDHRLVQASLGIPEDRFVLLTVRRLVRRMGIDNLIRAVAQLHASFPEVYLVIVGGGPMYTELLDLVTELQLTDHVRLTNRVPEEVLPLYYQSADLTVVPTVAWEGFGFVTVESMASGTPVAGTPIGGTQEILGKFDPNLLFEGVSVQDIVDGLRRLMQQRQRIPSRTSTRAHVLEHYTWDVVIPQIHQVFELAGAAR